MDDSGNVAENSQKDVDEEVGIATTFKKDTDGRQEDGEDDLRRVSTMTVVVDAPRTDRD